MIIAVGSTNPTKINPVKDVFGHHFNDVEVKGIVVSSGVAEQPMSEKECYQGAITRARKSLAQVQGATYGVGIEGGLRKASFGWFESSVVVIVNHEGKIGVGSSGGLVLPESIINRIQGGKNLEEAIDELFGTTKIGQGIGMFGIMTKGVVTRAEGVRHGVAFALARFLHENLYSP